MKKKILSVFALSLVIVMMFTGCDTKSFEAGGLSIVVGENGEFIQGESGTWEVPGKYKIEVTGVIYDDTGEAVEPILTPSGNVKYQPEGYFALIFQVTNLGYDLSDKDKENGEIQMSDLFSTFRINDGEGVLTRPYPYEEDDYEYEYSQIKLNYAIPTVEKGETKEVIYEFVTDEPIDVLNDVLVFTTFFNDGEKAYDGVFEMKFTSLAELLAE